jgi:membrane protein
MLISPIFLVMSGSVTIFITTQVTNITGRISLLGVFSPLIMIALKLFPYCLIGLLLTIIYMVMPNTKVNFRSGFIAGIIAGTTYVIVQWAYISFQVGIAKYNAIYGSFAAVPLFLVWVQISWLIVLFGAEISFAIQNVDTYEFEVDCLEISPAFKKLLSLRISHLLVNAFSKGEKPLSAPRISDILEIPIRLVRLILYELVESGLFSDTKDDEAKELAYQPARDINLFSVKYIIEALDHRGVDNIPVARTRELEALSNTLREFGDTIEKSPANKLLRDI